ncbi:hypothetical protein, partial [Paenibacillus phytohabitans]
GPLLAGAKGLTTLHTVLMDAEHTDTGLQEVSKFVEFDLDLEDALYIDVDTIERIKREVITVANNRISNEKQIFQNG